MRKSRVQKAKQKTWYMFYISIIAFIVSYILIYIFSAKGLPENASEYMLTQCKAISMVFSLMISLFTFYLSYTIIWNKLKSKMNIHNSERYVNHYNMCLTLMEQQNYQKALQVYNKIFGKSNQPVAHILRVSLKVANKQTLKDEIITLENLSVTR